MPGWWRPVVVWLLASAALDALVLLRGGLDVEPLAYVAMPASIGVLFGVIVGRAIILPGRFLAGLRESGPLDVVEDDIDWFGARRIVARRGSKEWVVESASAAKGALLFVQGPGDPEPVMAKGDPKAAGRAAAARA